MTAEDMRTDLLERILAAHKSFYDIRRDYLFEGRTFPAFAEYHTYGEKYVLVKRAKLWPGRSAKNMCCRNTGIWCCSAAAGIISARF